MSPLKNNKSIFKLAPSMIPGSLSGMNESSTRKTTIPVSHNKPTKKTSIYTKQHPVSEKMSSTLDHFRPAGQGVESQVHLMLKKINKMKQANSMMAMNDKNREESSPVSRDQSVSREYGMCQSRQNNTGGISKRNIVQSTNLTASSPIIKL